MTDDDLLFDYMFLEAQDKAEENEKLKEENENLKNQLNEKKTSVNDNEENYDKIRFFAEDVQSIAADCWEYMEITYEEAEEAIRQWYTPEDYYEFKINNKYLRL